MFTFKIYNVNIWSKLNQITSGNFVWREQFTMFILYFLLSYIFPSISTKSSWDSSASVSFGSTCTEKFQCDLKLLTTNKATARTSPPTISQQNLAYSYLKGTYECWQDNKIDKIMFRTKNLLQNVEKESTTSRKLSNWERVQRFCDWPWS